MKRSKKRLLSRRGDLEKPILSRIGAKARETERPYNTGEEGGRVK